MDKMNDPGSLALVSRFYKQHKVVVDKKDSES